MDHLKEQWISTSTDSRLDADNIDYHYITSNKLLYGIYDIYIMYNKERIKTRAKFDTGAKHSSIDLKLASKLGIEDTVIDANKELEKIEIPKDISKNEKKQLEYQYTQEFSKKFPSIHSIRIVKSASGFTLRPFVNIQLEINGRVFNTQANIKDRSGMDVPMLVGLNDLI